MELNSSYKNNVGILKLGGRLDAHEASRVRNSLEKLTGYPQGVAASPSTLKTGNFGTGQAKVVMNLADVNFIDSSGLAVLVQGMKRCQNQDGNLHLCHLQQSVRIIFELTRLDRAFKIFANEEEAIQAFST